MSIEVTKFNFGNSSNNKNKINFLELFRLDFSLILLIFSNIFAIYLAITQQWSLIIIMWIFWSQSVIIGIFNFIRLLTLKNFSTKNFKMNKGSVEITKNTKYITAFFFLMHYGGFHLGYMVFLLSSSFRKMDLSLSYNNPINTMGVFWIFITAIIFFGNHLYPFGANYENDKKKVRDIGTVMFFPYARIIPMHLTIVFGLFLSNSLFGIIFFMILKTIADVVMHQVEHHI